MRRHGSDERQEMMISGRSWDNPGQTPDPSPRTAAAASPTTRPSPTMTPRQAIPPPRWTVQALLGWLLIACLVPGIISTAFLIIHEYRDGQARQERDTLLTARALVQAVDAHLLKAQTAALALSTAGSLTKGN